MSRAPKNSNGRVPHCLTKMKWKGLSFSLDIGVNLIYQYALVKSSVELKGAVYTPHCIFKVLTKQTDLSVLGTKTTKMLQSLVDSSIIPVLSTALSSSCTTFLCSGNSYWPHLKESHCGALWGLGWTGLFTLTCISSSTLSGTTIARSIGTACIHGFKRLAEMFELHQLFSFALHHRWPSCHFASNLNFNVGKMSTNLLQILLVKYPIIQSVMSFLGLKQIPEHTEFNFYS